MIASVTRTLVDNFDTHLESQSHESSKAVMENQHEINQSGPLKLWLDMLDNSELKFESWKAAASAEVAWRSSSTRT